jgi:hypothetical protein
MSKIKVGFEITDSWNIEAFRNIIYTLKNKPQDMNSKLVAGDIELFLVSTNDSSFYIWAVRDVIELAADHAFNSPTTASKLATIEAEKIQIFLDNLQNTVMQIDELSEYADGILVDYKMDGFNLNPKWYQQLQEKINRLVDESC